MVQSKPNFVTATLPSGNVLVCDNSNLPQDLFLVNSADVEKAVTNFNSRELKPEAVLKHVIILQFYCKYLFYYFVSYLSGYPSLLTWTFVLKDSLFLKILFVPQINIVCHCCSLYRNHRVLAIQTVQYSSNF